MGQHAAVENEEVRREGRGGLASPRWVWVGLSAVLLSYIALATVQSYATRLLWGPDEPAHVIYVRSLAEDGRLPTLVSDERLDAYEPGAARSHQAHHPPVYHALAALVWRAFSRLPDERVSYPRRDGEGETTYVAPGPVRPCRLLSVVFGIVTLSLTWAAARTAFPRRPQVWLAGTAWVAYTPMFTYLSGVVNNDVLLMAFFAAVAWGWARVARGGGSYAAALLLGLLCGAALQVKETALALVIVSAAALALAPGESSSRKRLGWLSVFAVAVTATGIWWYLRKWVVYGHPLVYAYHSPLVELPPDQMVQVINTLPAFIFAYLFVPLDVVASHLSMLLVFSIYGGIAVLSVVGLLVFVRRARGSHGERHQALCTALYLITALVVLAGIVRLVFLVDWRMGPAGGRLLAATLPMLALVSARGLSALFGGGRWAHIGLAVIGLVLLAVNVAVIWATAAEYHTLGL